MDGSVSAATEGDPVIDANGDRLGVVETVEDGRVLVDPAEDISQLAKVVLGWRNDGDAYSLADRHVASVTDEGVYLKSNL